MVKRGKRSSGRELDIDDERPRRGRPRRAGSRPTHLLRMKSVDREESGWATVGVAWERDGLLSVRLSKGVVLDWHDFHGGGEFTLIMVPNDGD